MYVPRHFSHPDRELAIEFMHEFGFATVVGHSPDFPTAVHVPVLVSFEKDKLILSCHVAKANPIADTLTNSRCLVIFQGPHSYISPSLYSKTQSVPTWDYVSVHASGVATLVEDEAVLHAEMIKLISKYDKAYLNTFSELDPKYIDAMYKAIYGIRIVVDDLQSSFKLSQNRPDPDKQNVHKRLRDSIHSNERQIAEWMEKIGVVK